VKRRGRAWEGAQPHASNRQRMVSNDCKSQQRARGRAVLISMGREHTHTTSSQAHLSAQPHASNRQRMPFSACSVGEHPALFGSFVSGDTNDTNSQPGAQERGGRGSRQHTNREEDRPSLPHHRHTTNSVQKHSPLSPASAFAKPVGLQTRERRRKNPRATTQRAPPTTQVRLREREKAVTTSEAAARPRRAHRSGTAIARSSAGPDWM
jgi:hypothetical protein